MKLYRYDSKSLQFKKFPISTQALKALFTAILIFMFLGMSTTEVKTEYVTNTEDILLVRSNREFSEEKLVNLLKELNLPYPHITLAQAKLESGEFSSRIFKENHNLFGMKEAKVRVNLAQGTQYGHAYYNSWEESVLDYAFWYSSYARKCKTENELFQLLDQQYAEADQYVSSLKHIISDQQLKEKFNGKN
jgi:uncharacterized FlgJ-related protein